MPVVMICEGYCCCLVGFFCCWYLWFPSKDLLSRIVFCQSSYMPELKFGYRNSVFGLFHHDVVYIGLYCLENIWCYLQFTC
ncbi:hypothetical protein Hdeb2414_s0820g00950561 [Helianthus debilis subsp. tardiflorus]